MSQPTTGIMLNSTTPAAPSGQQNVVFQTDDGTPQQLVTAYDQLMVGDTGSGGKAGNVPAPGAGDAAAGKFLNAGGSWAVPSGGGGGGDAGSSDIQQESYIYAADTGTSNDYAVALSPAPTLVAGSVVVFKAANANTGTSTLIVNSGTAINIVKGGSTPLTGGEIVAGQIIEVVYDGTSFQIVGGGGVAGGLVAPALVDTGSPSIVGLEIMGSESAPDPLYVQSFFKAFNSTTSYVVGFTSDVQAGDLLLVFVQTTTFFSPTVTVADSLGNTYTQIATAGGAGYPMFVFAATNVLGGACTVTITSSVAATAGVLLAEYGDMVLSSVYDVSAGTAYYGTSPTSITMGPITTTANDLIIAVAMCNNEPATYVTPSGYTSRLNGSVTSPTNFSYMLAETASPAGVYSATLASSGANNGDTAELLIGLKVGSGITQTADLLQLKDHSGTVLSSVNALGQFGMALTSGAPTNTPVVGACAFDPATDKLWIYGTSGWKSVTLT